MNPSNIVWTTIVTYLSFAFVFFVVKARSALSGMENMLALFVFVFLSGMLQWFANIQLYKRHCGGSDMMTLAYATWIPWLFIFCGFTLAINTFPGWLRVFSNTLGSYILSQSGLSELVTQLYDKHPLYDPSNPGVLSVDMLGQIYTKQADLILELDIENVTKNGDTYSFPALEELVKLNILQNFEADRKPLVQKVYHKLLLKDEIGYFCWYTLVGTFFILVSTNTLLSSTCSPKKA